MGILEQRRAAFKAARLKTSGRHSRRSHSVNKGADSPQQSHTEAPDIPGAQFDDPMYLTALEADIAGLKAINSHVHRNAVKRDEKLPRYVDYLKKRMEQGKPAGAVLVQNMIWAFDAEQMDYGFELAQYAIAQKGMMPLAFKRDIPNFVLGQTADWALDLTAKHKNPNPFLSKAIEWMDNAGTDFDIIDKIKALLFKAQADVVFQDAELYLSTVGTPSEEDKQLSMAKYQRSLALYEKAQELDEKAGCKLQIKRLIKTINESKG